MVRDGLNPKLTASVQMLVQFPRRYLFFTIVQIEPF